MWVKYKPHSVAALLSTPAQEWEEYCYSIQASSCNKRRQFSIYQSIASGDWFAGSISQRLQPGLRWPRCNSCMGPTRETQRCSRGIWTEWLMWKLQNGKRPVCATMQRILQRRRIRTLRLAWSLMAVLALILAVCSAIFTVWTMRQTRDLSRSFQTLQERLEQVNAMSFKCTSDACMHSHAHLSKQFSLITQWFCNYAFSFF